MHASCAGQQVVLSANCMQVVQSSKTFFLQVACMQVVQGSKMFILQVACKLCRAVRRSFSKCMQNQAIQSEYYMQSCNIDACMQIVQDRKFLFFASAAKSSN